MRIGIGYDVHRLEFNCKLILGGVEIPNEKGLSAHSDGDCLVHAIIDSILGACGLNDIGTYFPDSDQRFKNISSLNLLSITKDMITEKGYKISNLDSVIVCQSPKINPYIDSMKTNISNILKISKNYIGIKATTEERLGFTGKKEGIACQAVCLLCEI